MLDLDAPPIDFDVGPKCQLRVYPGYFGEVDAHRLQQALAWQSAEVTLFGRRQRVPRLLAWYGDVGIRYGYSGLTHCAEGWAPELLPLRQALESLCQTRFNSVLCNLYRDGRDGMGWHADNEASLGHRPCIASVSFGEARKFQLKHRFHRHKGRIDIALQHGDVLIMRGALQSQWLHSVPKTRRAVGARINLTFRQVVTP